VHEAEALGLSMPVIERSRATWDAAQAAGWGDRDFTTILPFVRGDDRPA
jgi:3-hydroxyisobutyrate dehydrogenase-like beta-hydroxyacid dehydrogenase